MGKTTAQKDAHAVKDGIRPAVGDTTKAYFLDLYKHIKQSESSVHRDFAVLVVHTPIRHRLRQPRRGRGVFAGAPERRG